MKTNKPTGAKINLKTASNHWRKELNGQNYDIQDGPGSAKPFGNSRRSTSKKYVSESPKKWLNHFSVRIQTLKMDWKGLL